jgi:HEAT repeat protein
VKQLLAGGMKQKASIEWRSLLKHPDQRIRLAAEWALAAAPDGAFLLQDAALSPNGGPEPSIGRVHGVWGLGMVARRAEEKTPGDGAKIVEPLVPLLEDEDAEVRAQAAGVLGEFRVEAAFDPDEKVSRFAAEALARLGRKEVLPQLLIMIREEGSHDPYLRHAYVDALLGMNDFEAIEKVAGASSPEQRMVALLAMRQLARPEIARFLNDEEPLLVREAAMAIIDENITGALSPLAGMIDKPSGDEALTCRILDANFRVGEAANAAALGKFASREEASEALRIDALKLLGIWAHPPAFDYVTGAAQPTNARDAAPAREALETMAAHGTEIKKPAVVEALKAAQSALGQGAK